MKSLWKLKTLDVTTDTVLWNQQHYGILLNFIVSTATQLENSVPPCRFTIGKWEYGGSDVVDIVLTVQMLRNPLDWYQAFWKECQEREKHELILHVLIKSKELSGGVVGCFVHVETHLVLFSSTQMKDICLIDWDIENSWKPAAFTFMHCLVITDCPSE